MQTARSHGAFVAFLVTSPKIAFFVPFHRAKWAWFIVRLREVGTIGFSTVNQSLMPLVNEAGQRQSMIQCLEIVLKNQMLATMISCGRSPRMFYFPEDLPEKALDKIKGKTLKV